MEKIKVEKFVKSHSFEHFKSFNNSEVKEIVNKLVQLNSNLHNSQIVSNYKKKIINRAIQDLKTQDSQDSKEVFSLKSNSIAELQILDKDQYLEYIFHRYRYEIFPNKKELDDFPPCLQIEPSSICNYRCVFCFETDKTFTEKKGKYSVMNVMIFAR